MSNASPSRKRSRDDSYNGSNDRCPELPEQAGCGGKSEGDSADRDFGQDRRYTACLRKGMVILKGFLSESEQADLAVEVGRLGELKHGGFYSCHNEKTKRMRMMNLGLKTDGKKHVLAIPREWTEAALRACRLATQADPSIPVLRPDICVVNHYTAASRLGWHQDLSSSRDPGLPVISFSLGQTATFQYRVSWKKTAAVKYVTLESGDALIFGGRSRGIIHSVPGLDCATAPPATCDTRVGGAAAGGDRKPSSPAHRHGVAVPGGGRFNLNFREL